MDQRFSGSERPILEKARQRFEQGLTEDRFSGIANRISCPGQGGCFCVASLSDLL